MTTKERAELKSKAMLIDSIFNIGKIGLTPEFTEAVLQALRTRELIKISVLKNCDYDIKELAITIAERTHSQVVQVIGRKIVLYKENPDLHKKEKKDSKSQSKSNKNHKSTNTSKSSKTFNYNKKSMKERSKKLESKKRKG